MKILSTLTLFISFNAFSTGGIEELFLYSEASEAYEAYQVENKKALHRDFCNINNKYYEKNKRIKALNEENPDMKRQLYKAQRKREFKNSYEKYVVDGKIYFENWEGVTKRIDAYGEDGLQLYIWICNDWKTWHTQLNWSLTTNHPFYETLLVIPNKTKVFLSGNFKISAEDFIKEKSLTRDGSLSNPEYEVELSNIGLDFLPTDFNKFREESKKNPKSKKNHPY